MWLRWALTGLNQWFSKNAPQTNGIGITWELARNSQNPPQTCWIRTSGCSTSNLSLHRSSREAWCLLQFENHVPEQRNSFYFPTMVTYLKMAIRPIQNQWRWVPLRFWGVKTDPSLHNLCEAIAMQCRTGKRTESLNRTRANTEEAGARTGESANLGDSLKHGIRTHVMWNPPWHFLIMWVL